MDKLKEMIEISKPNTKYMLKLVQSYLSREIEDFEFKLDFSDALDTRYRKMLKENPEFADMLYYFIFEQGINKYYDLPEEKFYKVIQNNVDEMFQSDII